MSFPKTKVRRGLANILWKQFGPVNNNPKFKEDYADKSMKFLYNLTDQTYAALITIENGKLDIDHIPNIEKEINKIHADASLSCPASLFFDFSGGELSKFGALIKMITGKLKIKNVKKMQELQNLMSYL